MRPGTERLLLAAILLLGLAARLNMAVTVPLMRDEYSWADATDTVDPPPGTVHLPVTNDFHPAGQAYWNTLGVALFGRNVLGYRIVSVLLGTAAIWVLYLLGRRFWGAKVGLLAAFLLAVNEYHLGISQLCNQKNYLTLALLTVLLFDRALASPSTRRFAWVGLAAGLGGLTGMTVFLWAPVIALELSRPANRRLWKCPGPWVAAGICIALLSPYLIGQAAQPSAAEGDDFAFQATRFRWLSWSWAPLSLYIRPLYFLKVEGTISEYPSMTTLTGGAVLLAAVAALFLIRDRGGRFVQALGWWPFLFFTFFSRPAGELFWADFSLPPFILLTSALVWRWSRTAPVVAAVLVAVFAWRAVPVATARERYFPLDWGEVHPVDVERYRNGAKIAVARWRERDHVALSTVGEWRTPLFHYYRECLREYRDKLVGPERRSVLQRQGWLVSPDVDRDAEAAWAAAELQRFDTVSRR